MRVRQADKLAGTTLRDIALLPNRLDYLEFALRAQCFFRLDVLRDLPQAFVAMLMTVIDTPVESSTALISKQCVSCRGDKTAT